MNSRTVGRLAAIALLAELHIGDLVSYTWPGQQRVHCMRVDSAFIGVDGRPWAWLTDQSDPRLVLKLPAADLVKGCDATERP